MFGVSPIFQANQIIQITNAVLLADLDSSFLINFSLGLLLSLLVSLVIFGGIKRIGKVASKLVPFMVLIYMITVFYILILNYNMDPIYKNKGSAIFIHVARKNYKSTAGCIAVNKKDLRGIIKKINKRTIVTIN